MYAVEDGRPHLRVENRVLPAGPTVADVVANAAFYYGLVRALAETERPVWTQMSFAAAADNLVEGSRQGIDARVYWPGIGEAPVTELTLRRLLPQACEGLRQWGVDAKDADRMLGIIEQRCLTGRTGATWQVETVRTLERGQADRREALRRMTQGYIERMAVQQPDGQPPSSPPLWTGTPLAQPTRPVRDRLKAGDQMLIYSDITAELTRLENVCTVGTNLSSHRYTRTST